MKTKDVSAIRPASPTPQADVGQTSPQATHATAHTPTPWGLSSDEGDHMQYIVADRPDCSILAGRVLIAQVKRHRPGSADRVPPADMQNGNAELIVRAVNAHEDLVATLRYLEEVLSDRYEERLELELIRIRAALAKAEAQ